MVEYEIPWVLDDIEVVLTKTNGETDQHIIDSIKGVDKGVVEWYNDVMWNNEDIGIPKGFVNGVLVDVTQDGREGLIEIKERGNVVYLWHLFVEPQSRGKGIGSVLMEIFKEFSRKSAKPYVAGRVGNGGTKKFLVKKGFPEEELEVAEVTVAKSRPTEVVAIGFKNEKINVETAEAMESAPGFDKRKIEGL